MAADSGFDASCPLIERHFLDGGIVRIGYAHVGHLRLEERAGQFGLVMQNPEPSAEFSRAVLLRREAFIGAPR